MTFGAVFEQNGFSALPNFRCCFPRKDNRYQKFGQLFPETFSLDYISRFNFLETPRTVIGEGISLNARLKNPLLVTSVKKFNVGTFRFRNPTQLQFGRLEQLIDCFDPSTQSSELITLPINITL